MTWADGSRWDLTRGRALVELLVGGYPSEEHMRILVQELGMSLSVMPPPMELGLRWYELARKMHDAGTLRQAAESLVTNKPVLRVRVSELLDDDPAHAGNPQDPYEVLLLSGQRPLIGRPDLRTALRDFLDGNLPVLVVRGDPRTGKSYSLQLILHVTDGHPDILVRYIDFSPAAAGNDASALMTKLRRRLGLPPAEDLGQPTTRARSATELVEDLVDDLVGRYEFRDQVRRILVVDGLNRLDLQADVHQLVGMLMKEVIYRQLPRTQLVLTGYAGQFDPALGDSITPEQVVPITAADVRFYFERLVLHRTLTDDELDSLVGEVVTGEGDIEDLARRVRSAVLRLMRPVPVGGTR